MKRYKKWAAFVVAALLGGAQPLNNTPNCRTINQRFAISNGTQCGFLVNTAMTKTDWFMRRPGHVYTVAIQASGMETTYFGPSKEIYIGDQELATTVSCDGTWKYGCRDIHNTLTVAAYPSPRVCENNTMGPNPYGGTWKECACIYNGATCAFSYTISSSTHIYNAVYITNANDAATATTNIKADNAYRDSFRLYLTQTDQYGRPITAYQTWDITMCGKEKLTDSQPGVPIKKVYPSINAADSVIDRGVEAAGHYTLDVSGTDTNTNCGGVWFETYDDAACTIRQTDTKLTHILWREDVWTAGNQAATNGIQVDTSAPFAPKTKYTLWLTYGLASFCKPIIIEVCGWETVSPKTTAIEHKKYTEFTGTSQYQYPFDYRDMFNDDSTNCLIPNDASGFSLLDLAGAAYSNSRITLDFTQSKIKIWTNQQHDTTIKIKAKTTQSPNFGLKQLRVTICSAAATITTTGARIVLDKDSHSGLYTGRTAVSHFQNYGPAECLTGATYAIKTTSNTAYDPATQPLHITIDGSNNVAIKTDKGGYVTIRVEITTDLNQVKYHEMEVHVCGYEAVNTIPTSVPIYNRDLNVENMGAGTKLWQFADAFKSLLVSTTAPNVDTNICPIDPTKYRILIKDAQGNFVVYPGTDIYNDGHHLMIKTGAAIPKKTMWIQAFTVAGVNNKQEITVRVCGDETITLADSNLPFYNYLKGTQTETPVDVRTYFVQDDLCPMISWTIDTMVGNSYSNLGGTQFTIDATSKNLQIVRQPPQPDYYIWIKAVTATPVIQRKKVHVWICGSEQIVDAPGHDPVPYYILQKNQGSGTVTGPEVSKYFSVTQYCPITTYTLYQDTSGTCSSYTYIHSRIVQINSIDTLQFYTSSNLAKKLFCISANTFTPIYWTKKFYLKICGVETIQIINSATLDYKLQPKTGDQVVVDLTTVFRSNDAECPVSFYKVFKSDNVTLIDFVWSDTSRQLVIKTDVPKQTQTLYLRAYSDSNRQVTKTIYVTVCGYEEVYSIVNLTGEQTEYTFEYSPEGGYKQLTNTLGLFDYTTSRCPITTVSLKLIQNQTYTDWNDPRINVVTDGAKKMIQVKTNEFLAFTTIMVWAETQSGANAVQPLNLTVCTQPTSLIGKSSTFSKSAGTQILSDASALFNFTNGCPPVQYSLKQKSGEFYNDYSGTDIQINSKNQIEVKTDVSMSKSVIVAMKSKIDKISYSEVEVIVCGEEEVKVIKEGYKNLSYSFKQFEGEKSIVNRNLYLNPDKMDIAQSSIPSCPVKTHELWIYNSTLQKYELFNNDSIKMNKETGRITFNTTVPVNLTIQLRINSIQGSKPAEILFNLVVLAKPTFIFNAKPILKDPPKGANLVVSPNQKLPATRMKISEIFDDNDLPGFLNFTNRDFGRLQIKFTGKQPSVFQNESKYMTYDPVTTDLIVMFQDEKEALRFKGQNVISVDVSDVQGEATSYKLALSVYQASGEVDISDSRFGKGGIGDYKGQKVQDDESKNKSLVNPPGYWFAYVEKVSVLGDVLIRFNREVEMKDFNLSDINEETLIMYLDYTVERLQDDIDQRDFNFTWRATELGADFMKIKCNFTKPFAISQNIRFDRLVVHFKRVPKFFKVNYTMMRKLQQVDSVVLPNATEIGSEMPTNLNLFSNYTTLTAIIPRQINSNDEKLVEISKILNFVLAMIIFGGIGASFIVKIQIEKFLYVINELQLLFHLPLMNLNVPGNVLIVFTQLINLTKYDFLDHFKLIDFQKSISDAQNQPHQFFNGYWFQLGYRSYNIFANIGTLLIVIAFWLLHKIIRVCIIQPIANRLESDKLKKVQKQKVVEGRQLFIQSFLINVVASTILLFAPEQSIDRTPLFMSLAGIILAACAIYPIVMVIRMNHRLDKKEYVSQRRKLALFFGKRICFLALTFFLPHGSLQVICLYYTYFGTMFAFSTMMPLSSKRNNCFGVLNDFLLLLVLTHLFFFPGVSDELTKYEIGKSMLVTIAIFLVVNLYFFFNKAMRQFRVWVLRSMSPEMRLDLWMCLGVLHLRWVLFNTDLTREELNQQRLKAINDWERLQERIMLAKRAKQDEKDSLLGEKLRRDQERMNELERRRRMNYLKKYQSMIPMAQPIQLPFGLGPQSKPESKVIKNFTIVQEPAEVQSQPLRASLPLHITPITQPAPTVTVPSKMNGHRRNWSNWKHIFGYAKVNEANISDEEEDELQVWRKKKEANEHYYQLHKKKPGENATNQMTATETQTPLGAPLNETIIDNIITQAPPEKEIPLQKKKDLTPQRQLSEQPPNLELIDRPASTNSLLNQDLMNLDLNSNQPPSQKYSELRPVALGTVAEIKPKRALSIKTKAIEIDIPADYPMGAGWNKEGLVEEEEEKEDDVEEKDEDEDEDEDEEEDDDENRRSDIDEKFYEDDEMQRPPVVVYDPEELEKMVQSQTQFQVTNIMFEDLNVHNAQPSKDRETSSKSKPKKKTKKVKISDEDALPKKKTKEAPEGLNKMHRPSMLWHKIADDAEWIKMADPPLPSMMIQQINPGGTIKKVANAIKATGNAQPKTETEKPALIQLKKKQDGFEEGGGNREEEGDDGMVKKKKNMEQKQGQKHGEKHRKKEGQKEEQKPVQQPNVSKGGNEEVKNDPKKGKERRNVLDKDEESEESQEHDGDEQVQEGQDLIKSNTKQNKKKEPERYESPAGTKSGVDKLELKGLLDKINLKF